MCGGVNQGLVSWIDGGNRIVSTYAMVESRVLLDMRSGVVVSMGRTSSGHYMTSISLVRGRWQVFMSY